MLNKHAVFVKGEKCYQHKLSFKPVVLDYSVDDFTYHKYTCPVCQQVGVADFSFHYGCSRCPICGVNLDWFGIPV